MHPITAEDFRIHPELSFRLHDRARRERARAIGRLVAALVARLSLPRPAQILAARWG